MLEKDLHKSKQQWTHRVTIQIYVDVTAEPSAIYWLYLVFEIGEGINTFRCVGVTKRPVTLSVSYALSRIGTCDKWFKHRFDFLYLHEKLTSFKFLSW